MIYHSHGESIIDANATGFSTNKELVFCGNSHKMLTPLYKENFFNEFETELEKETAKSNLGISGLVDIDKAISNLKNLLKSELTVYIQQLINNSSTGGGHNTGGSQDGFDMENDGKDDIGI